MSDDGTTGNTIQATPGAIPPPVGKLPFVDSRGYLTQVGLIVLQQMWAALQGQGGVLDINILELPSGGVTQAQAQALINEALPGIVARDNVAGRLANIQGIAQAAEDLARLELGRPLLVPSPSSSSTGFALVASENIAAHALVNVWSNSGAFDARNADTTSSIAAPKDAHGFLASAVTTGGVAQVLFQGFITGLSGLTPGPAFLGATGAITSTPNVTAGQISQQVGIAVSATTIWFAPQPAIGL